MFDGFSALDDQQKDLCRALLRQNAEDTRTDWKCQPFHANCFRQEPAVVTGGAMQRRECRLWRRLRAQRIGRADLQTLQRLVQVLFQVGRLCVRISGMPSALAAT